MPRVPKIKTTRQIAADLDTIVPKDTELSVRNVFGSSSARDASAPITRRAPPSSGTAEVERQRIVTAGHRSPATKSASVDSQSSAWAARARRGFARGSAPSTTASRGTGLRGNSIRVLRRRASQREEEHG